MLTIFGHTFFGQLAGGATVVVPPPDPEVYAVLQMSDLRVGGDASPSAGELLDGVTWISERANGTPKVFIERTPDYVQFTLRDEDGDPIDESVFTTMLASLRDQRGYAFAGRDRQNVLNVNGGAWVATGTFRLSLSASDLVSRGAQEYQVRELTLEGAHSDGQPWHWVFFFTLRNLRSIT